MLYVGGLANMIGRLSSRVPTKDGAEAVFTRSFPPYAIDESRSDTFLFITAPLSFQEKRLSGLPWR